MSDTLTPETLETRKPAEHREELLELAEALQKAADLRRETIEGLEPGVARRATKQAQQLQAASRLIARGWYLDLPPNMRTLTFAANRASNTSADLSVIDATIHYTSQLIVGLHKWRGHTACLPKKEGE